MNRFILNVGLLISIFIFCDNTKIGAVPELYSKVYNLDHEDINSYLAVKTKLGRNAILRKSINCATSFQRNFLGTYVQLAICGAFEQIKAIFDKYFSIIDGPRHFLHAIHLKYQCTSCDENFCPPNLDNKELPVDLDAQAALISEQKMIEDDFILGLDRLVFDFNITLNYLREYSQDIFLNLNTKANRHLKGVSYIEEGISRISLSLYIFNQPNNYIYTPIGLLVELFKDLDNYIETEAKKSYLSESEMINNTFNLKYEAYRVVYEFAKSLKSNGLRLNALNLHSVTNKYLLKSIDIFDL